LKRKEIRGGPIITDKPRKTHNLEAGDEKAMFGRNG